MSAAWARPWGAAAAAVVGLAILFGASLASAQAADKPTACRIGAYLVSIHDLDTSARTVKADFWLWSVCPNKDLRPLTSMEFVNSSDAAGSLDATLPRGGEWWSTRKISGTFRQNFSLQDYPFDRQTLEIDMEEGVQDARDLLYAADDANSGAEPGFEPPGWKIKGYHILTMVNVHPTTYGDPSLPKGESRYAGAQIVMTGQRARWPTFAKVTFPLYIAAFLALVSLLFDVGATDMFLGRMGVLGTSLFAVVLNYLSLDSVLGPHDGLFLLDQLHLACLLLILMVTIWSVYAYRHAKKTDRVEKVRRRDELVAIASFGLFVLVNIALIVIAVVTD